MKHHRLLLAMLLTIALAIPSFAQDAMKKDEIKKEHALKSYTCEPECGFMVRSHDDKEIVDVVKAHAKKAHNMDVADKDIMAGMKPAKMKKDDMKKADMMKK